MIEWLWPWMMLLAPLPWLVRRILPPARSQQPALRAPFFQEWQQMSEGQGGRMVRGSIVATVALWLLWLLLLTASARPTWIHTELTAVACSDPLESELPKAGTYAVTDGTARSELHTGDQHLRRDYRHRLLQQRDLLRSDLMRLGVPLLSASTDRPPFALLHNYYGDTRR